MTDNTEEVVLREQLRAAITAERIARQNGAWERALRQALLLRGNDDLERAIRQLTKEE
jgi:hypothetical protein